MQLLVLSYAIDKYSFSCVGQINSTGMIADFVSSEGLVAAATSITNGLISLLLAVLVIQMLQKRHNDSELSFLPRFKYGKSVISDYESGLHSLALPFDFSLWSISMKNVMV